MPAKKSSTSPSSPSIDTSSLVIPQDAIERAQSQSLNILETARTFTISSQSEADAAGLFRQECIDRPLKELDRDFSGPKQSAHRLHTSIVALHRKYAAPFLQAKEIIDSALTTWLRSERDRQLREAAEVARQLQESAEEAAAEEAARLLLSGSEEDAQEAEGVLARLGAGEIEPLSASIPMVLSRPKIEGISGRTYKKYRIVDENKIKRGYLTPDSAKIQSKVTEMGKEAEGIVGGIEVYEEEGIARRG